MDGMKKRQPRLSDGICIEAHGTNKLRWNWFQALASMDETTDPIIIGVDEAGRGPVFGPMVVGGSANLTGWRLDGIRDSKKIPQEHVRKALANEIRHNTIWAVAVIDVKTINQFGTFKSLVAAGQMVAAELVRRLRAYTDRPLRVIFDGRDHPKRGEAGISFESMEKADDKIFEVSCGSILAKVMHDDMVHDLVKSHSKYMHYDLDNNKGYPTPKHKVALKEFGLTDQHRVVACGTFLAEDKDGKAYVTTPTKVGA